MPFVDLLLAESYLHRLDPFVFRISGEIGVRWYGLAYLLGFLIGWGVLRWMARTKRTPLSIDQVGDFAFTLIVGVLVGGRVGHVLFYEPHMLWTFTGDPPWWELLAIQRGGMSSHGGILGVILACVWFARRRGISALHVLDLAAFVCPAGLGLGRFANFINGELWGRALPESMQGSPPWWSIKYPTEVFGSSFDAAKLASMRDAIVGVPLDAAGNPLPGAIVDAVMRGRADLIERLLPLLTAHWPSQIFQTITDGVLLPLVLITVWWKPRKPGAIGGWFAIAYGVLRLITEQFREPDEGVLWLGALTLPMVLCLLMIAVGVCVLVVTQRRDVPKLGGLRRIATP